MKYVLIGFMGAGKTTIGNALGKEYGLPFYDMDQEIVAQIGYSVSEFFDREGEQAFRKLEVEVLERLLTLDEDAVISTGGGTVTTEAAQKLLAQSEVKILWLNTDFATLYDRLLHDDVERPLFINNTKADFKALFDCRLSTYERLADLKVNRAMQAKIMERSLK